jgi:hypothetical protein
LDTVGLDVTELEGGLDAPLEVGALSDTLGG